VSAAVLAEPCRVLPVISSTRMLSLNALSSAESFPCASGDARTIERYPAGEGHGGRGRVKGQ